MYLPASADPGGAHRIEILLFSHTFSPKSARVGRWRPQREILDPPLTSTHVRQFFQLYFQEEDAVSFAAAYCKEKFEFMISFYFS